MNNILKNTSIALAIASIFTTTMILPVNAQTNESFSRTISPGKSGHISASVGYFSSDYEFKAVPSPNGGTIDIDYNIAQRD